MITIFKIMDLYSMNSESSPVFIDKGEKFLLLNYITTYQVFNNQENLIFF